MILRECILSELEKELGDLLADAPANLSESALKSIQAESIGLCGARSQFAHEPGNAKRRRIQPLSGEHAGAGTDEDALAVKAILDQGEA